jgi:hypothetical protein
MLECARCHKLKEEEQFYRNKNRKSGRGAYCKECSTKYIKEIEIKHDASFVPLETLTCAWCKETKPIKNNFFRAKRCSTGYCNVCSACKKERSPRSKEVGRRSSQKSGIKVIIPRMKENIQHFFNILGTSCIDCGRVASIETFPAFDIHHTQPEKKTIMASTMIRQVWKSEFEEELKTCVLLCACCHRLRHSKYTTSSL